MSLLLKWNREENLSDSQELRLSWMMSSKNKNSSENHLNTPRSLTGMSASMQLICKLHRFHLDLCYSISCFPDAREEDSCPWLNSILGQMCILSSKRPANQHTAHMVNMNPNELKYTLDFNSWSFFLYPSVMVIFSGLSVICLHVWHKPWLGLKDEKIYFWWPKVKKKVRSQQIIL